MVHGQQQSYKGFQKTPQYIPVSITRHWNLKKPSMNENLLEEERYDEGQRWMCQRRSKLLNENFSFNIFTSRPHPRLY